MHRVIETYLHRNEIGVLLELQCLDEASSKTAEFKVLAKDIAMQIAASCPVVVNDSDLKNVASISDDYLHQSLMGQSFIKDPEIKLKEKIEVLRFVRYDTKEI